jgi:hypothetical protein
VSDDRAAKPPTAYQLQSGDVCGFGYDFADGVVLYFQPPSLRGSILQVAMTRDQFFKLLACAREMESSMANSVVAQVAEDLAPQVPAPAMAGEES